MATALNECWVITHLLPTAALFFSERTSSLIVVAIAAPQSKMLPKLPKCLPPESGIPFSEQPSQGPVWLWKGEMSCRANLLEPTIADA